MSKIKVNAIESRSDNSLTFGATGDTITLGGSSFNGTSSVIWDTTAKTSGFTAAAGTGYFVDTSSAAVTATLPASPSAGDVVAFKDYAESFATNNLTIARNGSPIAGETSDALINTNKASIVMVYVDGTKGWLFTMESNIGDLLPQYVAATGGTITTSGDYKIHTFTSSGTFTVTNAGSPTGSNTVDYMVVAGGGGSGGNENRAGGGGGGGGFRESVPSPAAWTASPIANPGNALPVSVQGYPVTVGAGGSAPSTLAGSQGSNSVFSTITSAGGGGGAAFTTPGTTGGSGGGGSLCRSGSAGNTPPTSPPQGNGGGNGINPGSAPTEFGAGGGGGATASGGNATTAPGTSGAGGAGATTSISGSPTAYAGGGGGGAEPQGTAYSAGGGGVGGGGGGAQQPNSSPGVVGTAGTANTGGGGGGSAGGSPKVAGATGGSGIVIIRYKFQ